MPKIEIEKEDLKLLLLSSDFAESVADSICEDK